MNATILHTNRSGSWIFDVLSKVLRYIRHTSTRLLVAVWRRQDAQASYFDVLSKGTYVVVAWS